MVMRFISLFSGAGGFDLGFERAGMQCVAQVEWDKYCQQVLQHHWPHIPKWHDICDVNGADLPDAEVIIFGSPCQDLSIAGKRTGLDGERSSMFFEAIRVIKEMRDATSSRSTGSFPRYAVWENVPGALSSNNGEDFQAVIEALGDIGAMDIQWSVLDARYFGVPQRRRRLFLVAQFDSATSGRSSEEIFSVKKGRRRNSTTSRQKEQKTSGDATQSLASDFFRRLGHGHYIEDEMASTLCRRDDANDLVTSAFVQTAAGTSTEGDFLATSVCSKWVKGTGGPSGSEFYNLVSVAVESAEPIYSFDTQFGANANVFEDMTPTLKSSQQSPSIGTSYAIRRLTPLECERLMGWDDDHTAFGADGERISDSQRSKMCGNGVVAPVAEWVAKQIIKAETNV